MLNIGVNSLPIASKGLTDSYRCTWNLGLEHLCQSVNLPNLFSSLFYLWEFLTHWFLVVIWVSIRKNFLIFRQKMSAEISCFSTLAVVTFPQWQHLTLLLSKYILLSLMIRTALWEVVITPFLHFVFLSRYNLQ